MKPFTYHTHSTFCDGKNTPEEMVQSALAHGCDALGFSSHSPEPIAPAGTGTKDTRTAATLAAYRAEIRRLREAYRDRIPIFLGLEQDLFSPPILPTDGYDYRIGSIHYVEQNGLYLQVDANRDTFLSHVKNAFGNDPIALACRYFAQMKDLSARTNCDIVGHFDLITKYNEGECLFCERDRRYEKAAGEAAEALARQGQIFEINTGAIGRGYRSAPYPSERLLCLIRSCGGRVTYASDCHRADTITVGFDRAVALAKKCGFRGFMKLSEHGFYEQAFED